MMPTPEYTASYRHHLAAVGEGFCPKHELPLSPVTLLEDLQRAGWCEPCGGGWWIDGEEVVLRWPPRVLMS